ncbi:MAG: hypothetical protein SF187_23895 [Deltaproteobacteria bacterium]|nr:hypothetical protein [Deltaproteobacteria bacterium]
MRRRAKRTKRGAAVRACVGLLALLGAVATTSPAGAEVGSARRPVALYALGPTAELGLDLSLRFGGELSLSQYVGNVGYGAAFGANSAGRMFAELQGAWVLGTRHNLVLGLNPGVVIDVTQTTPRYGVQGTFWFNYAQSRRRQDPLASPLVPFVRAQEIPGLGFTFTFGVTLKLPLRAS